MTLQKAMRVRSELKKEAANLSSLLFSNDYSITIEETPATEDMLKQAREKILVKLDNMSYEQAVKKLFDITDALYQLNVAIEESNKKGHELLFKEASLKSKLSQVDKLINLERNILPEDEKTITDYETSDNKGNFKKVRVRVYNYSALKPDAFGCSLLDFKKKLIKELEEVRDELCVFNATQKINYELPDNLM